MKFIKIIVLNLVFVSTLLAQGSQMIQLRFVDINSFNFTTFEETYEVAFQYCVADGICLFKNNSQENTASLVELLKVQEQGLKEIKVYKNYKMKAF